MPADIQTIKTFELFKDLKPEELEQLAALMHPIRITEGEVLTRRTDPAHSFYVVLSGNYMIYFKEGRAFTLHNRGDIIGMATVITPFRYRGTTVALTDGEVLEIAGDKFLDLIQSDAALGDRLMHRLNDILAERTVFPEGKKPPETVEAD
ncbi:Crp/Fnr family transcriptional regulator [Desulfonema ishimotonii]|uniref:Crp/Fnr family transcriptional regulator n=1 Tax=Desulfonema ishimotonii TaxID=45657 RepID=A0A401G022_9BACT|nr:cyclic nucleotide-binding domain-containing protein [Desulfonema ishimotonii]GBC62533.1 Crp/Fnr family transcriptional regulator [Desulfonema ishimotonii]